MNAYFLSTLIVVTLLSILDILVSKTRNGKVAKTVISLVATFILVVPVISILKGEDFSNKDILSDEIYLKYLENLEDETVKRKIKMALNVGDFDYSDVRVEYDKNENSKDLKKVIIILSNGVILTDNEHINMIEKAKTLLEKVIDVKEVEIEIETD